MEKHDHDPVKTIRAVLTDKLHIDLKENPIRCDMESNSLLIEGWVDTVAQKKRALYHAMGLRGVTGIIDRLKVRPSKHMGDDEIKAHMLDALIGEQTLDPNSISIEVNDGIIDLEGQVMSLSHKRLAGALAWWIPGSTDVINSIEVVPAEDDNDDEIADAIRIIFEKDKLVDEAEIKVLVRNWVVTLEGYATSEAQKEAAEDDAWYIWGVNDVINNIQVGASGSPQFP